MIGTNKDSLKRVNSPVFGIETMLRQIGSCFESLEHKLDAVQWFKMVPRCYWSIVEEAALVTFENNKFEVTDLGLVRAISVFNENIWARLESR